MGTITTTLKVDADARAAVSGLRPLSASLDNVTKDAASAESALRDLDKAHTIKVNDAAIDNARLEITRLRASMRDQLAVDVNADTRAAQTRIRQLQSTVRTLDAENVEIRASVDVDDSELEGLGDSLADAEDGGLAAAGAIGGIGGAVTGISKSVPIIGGIVAGVGGIAVGATKAVSEMVALADQMENAKIAFTQFLGSEPAADRFLNNLRSFAAKTPFEFPELVDASKKLLAFGTDSDDVVGTMRTLGDVAALTGADVGELSTIWGQMTAKGKVSNEELLQLTENGVPAYEALAKAMGKTVPEITKMAEEGKLLSDKTLPILKKELDKTFGGGMAKQAQTLSGKWSTLKDTLGAMGTDLGEAMLPFVKVVVDQLQPALEGLAAYAKANKGAVAQSIAGGLAGVMEFGAGVLDVFGDVLNAVGLATAATGEFIIQTGVAINAAGLLSPAIPNNLGDPFIAAGAKAKTAGSDITAFGDDLHDTATGIRLAADGVRDFGDKVAAGFHTDQIREAIGKVNSELATLRKKPPTPEVELKIENALARKRKLQAELRALTAQERLVEVDADIHKAQNKAGQIRAALKNLRSQKATPEVRADIRHWTKELAKVRGNIRDLKSQRTNLEIKADAAQANQTLDKTARLKRKAVLGVEAPQADNVKRNLDETAGKKRTANIGTSLSGDDAVDSRLDGISADRYSTIYVTTVNRGGGGGGGGGASRSIMPQMLATGPALRAPAAAQVALGASPIPAGGVGGNVAAPGGVVTLAPRTTPVKVYLDGQEIADGLTMRAHRIGAASSSIRRRP